VTPADRDDAPPESEEPGGPENGETGITDEFEAALESELGDEFGAEVAAEIEEEPEQLEDAEEPEEPDAPEAPEAPEAPAEPGEDPELVKARLAQETVEADILALGDAEEAAEQEAAAGVGADEPPAAARPDDDSADEADPEAGEERADEEVEADEEAEEEATDEEAAPVAAAVATATPPQPRPAVPGAPPAAVAPGEDEGAPKSRLWLRFLAASFVIVVSMGTATAVTGLLYLTDIAKGLGGLDGVRDQLEQVEGGDPQNILILGSDERPDDPSARSDTTMLLRLDPEQEAIALFSLPRDLKVNIPGYGVDRLNAAYAVGGPKLALKTVKQVTGLTIHHVVNVDFTGFLQAVNAIDCVYVDVDRRYYVPPDAGYAEINVEAGYQLMCGERALQYVRFRHTDTDITRSARQQDFLREARQKITPTRVFRDREDLIDIFKKYTTSDIEEAGVMLEVLKLFLSVADAPVKEIHFEGNIGPSYVTFSQDQMEAAVNQFLGIEDTEGPRGGGALGAEEGGGGGGKDKPEPSLISSAEFGRQLAERFVRSTKFPVFYPTKITPGGQFSGDSRTYEIEDDDGKVHDIYKFVISTPLLGEYYGVSGTTWEDPPILANPSETREIGNREFELFYDGDRLRLVAWRTEEASYWLNNSLLQSIDEEQMLEIAETMEDVEPK
jgi:polyisoprenyl-teichoic acid--peptidoglycan teichoic acid transferase